jgi:transposase
MKFTFEQKLAAVKLHKEKGTYKYPKGYEAKSKKQVYRFYVQFWEAQYDRNGEEGIRHELNSAYSPEKKLSIITPVLMGEITGRQQAIRCGVRPSSIVLWIKRYRKDGLEGLKSCHPGRKPKNMPVISEKKEETDKTVAEDNQEDLKKKVEELEHENLLLHAELDYRKKLEALVEKRRKLERAKRPTPSSFSSKAKNTKEK